MPTYAPLSEADSLFQAARSIRDSADRRLATLGRAIMRSSSLLGGNQSIRVADFTIEADEVAYADWLEAHALQQEGLTHWREARGETS